MVDAAPDMQDMPIEKETERPALPSHHSPWKVYLKPSWLTLYLNRSKLIFGLLVGVWYLAQFIGCVACVNLYSDVDRLKDCNITDLKGEAASEVMDLPLVLLSIFHIIEWLRATLLLVVILIGVNWAIFWYITTFNTLFGIVVYAYVHMVYLGQGKECESAQPDRYMWLFAEMIAFWVLFFFFSFPMVVMFLRGKTTADKLLLEAYEKNGEDSD